MHIAESLDANILKPAHLNIRSVYVMLVRWPERELPEVLAWASFDSGVIAYRSEGSYANAGGLCHAFLRHLTSGSDPINAPFDKTTTWMPMPCAPLTFEPLEQEIASVNDMVTSSCDMTERFRDSTINAARLLWHDFIDSLDCIVWDKLNDVSADLPTCENYNLFLHEDRRIAHWRRQAFLENSLLVKSVARPLRAAWRCFEKRDIKQVGIISIIDSGKPLYKALSARLNIPSAVLRHCRTLSLGFLPDNVASNVIRQIASHLPVDHYPDSYDERYLRVLWYWLGHLELPRPELLLPLAARRRRRIAEELSVFSDDVSRYCDKESHELWDELAPSSFDIGRDFKIELFMCAGAALQTESLLWPMDDAHEEMERLIIEWLLTSGVSSFMRAATAWHELISTCHDESNGIGPDRWQPILDEPIQINDRVLIELADREALTQEGSSMKHCVSTYASRCAAGTRVFSIQNTKGERISTLALKATQIGDDIRFGIEQIRGYSNAESTVECLNVSARMTELANSWRLQARRKMILTECQRFAQTTWNHSSALVDLALRTAGKHGKPDYQPVWQYLQKVSTH